MTDHRAICTILLEKYLRKASTNEKEAFDRFINQFDGYIGSVLHKQFMKHILICRDNKCVSCSDKIMGFDRAAYDRGLENNPEDQKSSDKLPPVFSSIYNFFTD